MIQRIQTVYLFSAAIVAFILLFISIGTLQGEAGFYTYTPFSVKIIHTDMKIASTVFNALLLIGSSLLSLITILFYKKRKIQVRLINVNMIVILAALFCMLIVYPKWIFPSNEYLKGTILNFNFVLLISLFVALGLYLAKKAILKDEALIRSTERLR
jgi:hypothetical protein